MRYAAYPEYKESGVEWLGEVPNHWKILQIKRLTIVSRGASPRPIDEPKYFDESGEYAWVRIADVTASDTYLKKTKQQLSSLGASLSVKLEPDELFLSIAGSVGKPCITSIKACIHDGFVYFPNWRENKKFLFYLFAAGEAYKGLGKMGTQLNLNTDTVGWIKIGLPSLEEQIQIATFLDKETAKIDTLIEKQQALIKLLQEKRQAVISHAVTKGLNPDVPMKDSGIEWLGEVPEEWVVKRLKYISQKLMGRLIVQPHQYFNDEGVPIIFAFNIKPGEIVAEPLKRITLEADKRFHHCRLRKDDLVSVRVGDPGVTAVIPEWLDGCHFASMMAIRKSKAFLSNWLMHVMNSSFLQSQIDLVSYGAAQKQFNISDAKNFIIPCPSIDEQRKLISALESSVLRIDSLITKAKSAIELLKERRTALISAAVTGKIDVRNVA